MPSPLVTSVDWGDVVTTTLENRSKELKDNISNNNALLTYIKRSGKERPFEGGREIMEELEYAQNQSFIWYSGFEPGNISLNDTLTAARFTIKQAMISVTISGLEKVQNAGKEQMIDLLMSRVNSAEKTFWNQMSAGIYSDGTAFGGRQIGGLALLVSKTPSTGIVGGIDRAAHIWWQNIAIDQTTDPLGTVTASN
ncbi:MAG: phage major capsid protein, partial [Nitrososphaera sp.]